MKEQVYIAGPFFNSFQIGVIKNIETELANAGVSYFSPREEGVIAEILPTATPKEKEAILKSIYESNVAHLYACQAMVCVIDDRDTGTMWELGYFSAIRDRMNHIVTPTVVTFSSQGYGLNVMLSHCSDAHVVDFDNIVPALQGRYKQKGKTTT